MSLLVGENSASSPTTSLNRVPNICCACARLSLDPTCTFPARERLQVIGRSILPDAVTSVIELVFCQKIRDVKEDDHPKE